MLVDAKVTAITGRLPSELDNEILGFHQVLKWLASRSILEGVLRSGL